MLHNITTSQSPGGFLSYEFSAIGMLERLSIQIEKQQFCTEIPYSYPHSMQIEKMRWPPIQALRSRAAKNDTIMSCDEVCAAEKLICEPSFFPVLNRVEGFRRPSVNLLCQEIVLPTIQDTDYPAYDRVSGKCYLQTNHKLFSCAGNNNKFQRLCPCRDYIPGQLALCQSCGLN